MSRLSGRGEIISVFNISSAEAAEETWARAPRASHYIKSCGPSTASQKRKEKKKASEPQSINYGFERVHSYWMVVLLFVPYSPRADKKNDGNTRAEKVATISLKSERVGEKRAKK